MCCDWRIVTWGNYFACHLQEHNNWIGLVWIKEEEAVITHHWSRLSKQVVLWRPYYVDLMDCSYLQEHRMLSETRKPESVKHLKVNSKPKSDANRDGVAIPMIQMKLLSIPPRAWRTRNRRRTGRGCRDRWAGGWSERLEREASERPERGTAMNRKRVMGSQATTRLGYRRLGFAPNPAGCARDFILVAQLPVASPAPTSLRDQLAGRL